MSRTMGGFEDTRFYGAEATADHTYGATLLALAQADPRVVCLGADLTKSTQTHLVRDAMPERFFMIGMQEANMVGAAAGMARLGDVPFAHSFCVFITRRVYDQVAMQVAFPNLNVKLVGFIPGLTTPLGVSHQAIDDIALMRALPNMTIIEPSGPGQVAAAARAAHAHDGPVYLRLPLHTADAVPDIIEEELEIGRGQVLREGEDVAILASGRTVEVALRAADRLVDRGSSATVVNFHTLKPFDSDLVIRLAARHRAIVSMENHSIIGGLGSAVAEALAQARSDKPFRMIGVADVFAEGGSTPYLFDKHGLTPEHLLATTDELLAER